MRARKLIFTMLLLSIPMSPAAGSDVLTMRILYAPAPFNVPHMILRQQGILEREFKPYGWKVAWLSKPLAEPLAARALSARELDIAIVSDCAAVIARAGGNDMVLFKPYSEAPKAYAIVVPAKAEVRNVKALAGKKIGLPVGTAAQYLLARALSAEGLSLAKLTVVNKTYAEALAALSRGELQAAVLAEPFLSRAVTGGKARILRDGEGLIEGKAVVVIRRQFLENEEIMDRYGELMAQTLEYMARNPAEVAKIAARETGLPIDTARAVMAKHRFTALSSAKMLDDLVAVSENLAAQGIIKKPLTVKDLAGCDCD
ncbi:MAG: ABC transporter substrate-binding protein [Bacteroidota bacterium]